MNATPLPAHVRQAGEDIAADLFNANLVSALGPLAQITLTAAEPRNQDLIDAFVAGQLTSVEAIFIAMTRAQVDPQSP